SGRSAGRRGSRCVGAGNGICIRPVCRHLDRRRCRDRGLMMNHHEDYRQATPSELAEENRRMEEAYEWHPPTEAELAVYKWLQAEKRYQLESDEKRRRSQLPDFTVSGDYAYTTLVDEPCWLLVQRPTELSTGKSWLSVYRSMV